MNQDTHGSNAEEWIGFDLDGTLAKYDGWNGIEHIGEPVASMVVIAKMLHRLGKKIKILTARVAPRDDGEGGDKAKKYVEAWCRKNLGFVPEITYEKDASMAALFDDRAVAVEQNTGKVLGGWPDFLPKASDNAKKAVLGMTEKNAEEDGIATLIGDRDGKSIYRLDYDFSKAKDLRDKIRKYMTRSTLRKLLQWPSGSGGGFADRVGNEGYAIHIDNSGKYNKTDAERKFVELHELGHIVNGHSDEKHALGHGPKKERREEEANKYALDNAPPEMLDDIKKIIANRFGPTHREKKADAHHPDFYRIIKKLKDEYGIDLSHMRMKWSRHPRYVSGKRSYEFSDDETVGSHAGDSTIYINPNLRPVMNRFGISGKISDLRRRAIAHELAHEIQATYSEAYNPEFEKKITDEAKKKGFRTLYTDTVPERKFDKELFAEYMAHLLNKGDSLDVEKKADSRPSEEDLWRMYDIIQADARLSDKVSKLGFGNSGDAYRRAAIKLKIMELASVLKDGKKIRNNIVHRPGYIPTERDSERAITQYADADSRLSELLGKKAEIGLKDGKYRDVKRIYDALTDVEKDFITPGRTEYKDVPTWARTVAYDEEGPVGFADAYGRKNSANLCIAVSDAARGKRLARAMAYETMKKILDQIKKRREEAEQEGGRSLREFNRLPELKKFIWDVKKENIPSALAAEHAGFKEKHVPSRKWRRFVMKRRDAENLF